MPAETRNRLTERRHYVRVRTNLAGRYMLASRAEYSCRILNISPGGLALMASASGRLGERVVAYIDKIGRIEGSIVRIFSIGFAMVIATTEHGRERIARRLTRIRGKQNLPEIMS
jgi:hypothetical protein